MTPEEISELKECFLNMIGQHCGYFKKIDGEIIKVYDSMFLSANESALDFAVKMGWIKKEEVMR